MTASANPFQFVPGTTPPTGRVALVTGGGRRVGAVVVRASVVVRLAVMLWLVIREEVPANQRDMVTLLLGTLAGMASSVVAYWVGSSNGSMQKNATLERALAQK